MGSGVYTFLIAAFWSVRESLVNGLLESTVADFPSKFPVISVDDSSL
jgi:hypothetical protein